MLKLITQIPTSFKSKYMFLLPFFLLVTILACGCASMRPCVSIPIKGAQGEIHYLIIGVGVVTVPGENKETAILATKSQALGLFFSDQPGGKFAFGYSSGNVVAVPNGAKDVRVEISQKPFGPLKIDTQSAILTEPKTREEKPK